MRHFRWFPAVLACVLILGASFAASSAQAQQRAQEDVVYLENGTIVRGTIVEQVPGKHLSIRTRDGSVFVYALGDVSRITKEATFGQYASSSSAPGYKDPSTATLLGVLCAGCGHLWVGETGRGATLLGIELGAPIAGTIISVSACSGYSCSYAPMLAGLGAALGAWAYGIYDAGNSARRANASHGLALQPVFHSAGGSFGLGLSFATR